MVLRQLTTRPGKAISFLLVSLSAVLLYAWFCGVGSDLRAADPEPPLHTIHVVDQELACTDCHGVELTIQKDFCAECHDADEVEGLLVKFSAQVAEIGPPQPPADHTMDFRRAHGASASVDRDYCSRCHREDFCQDCHEGINISGRIHPLNFKATHFFDAQGQEEDCLVCHETRQFCTDCHRRNMVLPHMLGPGWANGAQGGTHAEEAESNLETCLDCHDLGMSDPVCTRPGCHN